MLVVPPLPEAHRRLVMGRWGSIRHLVEDAQGVRDVEIVVVVVEDGSRVSVGVIVGLDALALVAEIEPRAAAFTMARPWVPVVVLTSTGRSVTFASATWEN